MVWDDMDFVEFALKMISLNYSKIHYLKDFNIRATGEHCTNAFPSIPDGQLHIGMWLITSHNALCAHVPGHGFLHLL